MKSLGVCSWSLQAEGPSDLIQRVRNCDLRAMQLALDPLSSGSWSLELLKEELAASRIAMCSGMMSTIDEDYSSLESIRTSGGLRPDQHWEANLQRAHANAQLAAELGLELVTLHAGFIPEESCPERDTMIERIKTVADIFSEQGVKVGLETGQESAQTLLELLEMPALSNVGVNFDPANMILYGMGDPAPALEMLKERVLQVHMKDAWPTATPGTWGREVAVGEGSVDWAHLFAVLASLPTDVAVVIEREAGAQRVDDIKQAIEIAHSHGYQP